MSFLCDHGTLFSVHLEGRGDGSERPLDCPRFDSGFCSIVVATADVFGEGSQDEHLLLEWEALKVCGDTRPTGVEESDPMVPKTAVLLMG